MQTIFMAFLALFMNGCANHDANQTSHRELAKRSRFLDKDPALKSNFVECPNSYYLSSYLTNTNRGKM